jgi:hypothetical protein
MGDQSYHPRVHVPKPKFDSESAVRHTSQRCDTVRSVHLIAFVEMCIGKQRPDTFGIAFASMRHRGLGRMTSRRSQSRAPNGSSRQRRIHHEITDFHPVVSHLAGTSPVDRVPVDSICALAHALSRSPHEA